jgi:hypothetical protein
MSNITNYFIYNGFETIFTLKRKGEVWNYDPYECCRDLHNLFKCEGPVGDKLSPRTHEVWSRYEDQISIFNSLKSETKKPLPQ